MRIQQQIEQAEDAANEMVMEQAAMVVTSSRQHSAAPPMPEIRVEHSDMQVDPPMDHVDQGGEVTPRVAFDNELSDINNWFILLRTMLKRHSVLLQDNTDIEHQILKFKVCIVLPNRHKTLNQCWFNVGPAS